MTLLSQCLGGTATREIASSELVLATLKNVASVTWFVTLALLRCHLHANEQTVAICVKNFRFEVVFHLMRNDGLEEGVVLDGEELGALFDGFENRSIRCR